MIKVDGCQFDLFSVQFFLDGLPLSRKEQSYSSAYTTMNQFVVQQPNFNHLVNERDDRGWMSGDEGSRSGGRRRGYSSLEQSYHMQGAVGGSVAGGRTQGDSSDTGMLKYLLV